MSGVQMPLAQVSNTTGSFIHNIRPCRGATDLIREESRKATPRDPIRGGKRPHATPFGRESDALYPRALVPVALEVHANGRSVLPALPKRKDSSWHATVAILAQGTHSG